MPLPAQNALAWEICMTILHVLAIGLTLARLIHRVRTKALWWDDWVVIIPLVFSTMYLVMMWVESQASHLPDKLFFSVWFGNMMFMIIVWVSRASLALSIVRMFPKNHQGRSFGYTLTGIFSVLCVAMVLMATFDCYGTSPQWWNTPLPVCVAQRKGLQDAIYLTIAFDYLADICLTGTSVYFLWRSNLQTRERRLVVCLFFLSIPSFISSVYFSSLGLNIDKLGPSAFVLVNMGGHLQSSITLFVSNVLVFVLFFYRFVKKEPMQDSEDDTSATDEKASMSSAGHRAV